ncbi:MAG: acyltransferase [bacterium]|nr:acyltransferase [bacterium]
MKEPLVSRDRVDVLKAFAVVAVIFIHVVSIGQKFADKFAPYWFHLVTYDQVLRFCVPLFIALSGFGLAAKYSDSHLAERNQKIDLKDFYLRRVTKLLPQYLFFAVVLYSFLLLMQPVTGEIVHYNFFQAIFLGRADYHLYFVPLIFQFYLLFPLLFWIVKKNIWVALLITLFVQVGVFYVIGLKTETPSYNEPWNDQRQYILAISWVFYFVLGISLGLVRSVNAKRLRFCTLAALVLTVIGLGWTLFNAQRMVLSGIDLQAATRFTRVPVLVYSTGLIVFALFVKINLSKASPLRNLRGALLQIGRNSYTTYLLHTLVLRLFVLFVPFLITQNLFVFGFLVVVVSIVSSEVFNRVLNFRLKK